MESQDSIYSQTGNEDAAGGEELLPPPIELTSPSSRELSVRQPLVPSPISSPPVPNEFILDPEGPSWFTQLDLEDIIMVLEQMITVERTLTGDNTDFLAGTQLDQPGVPGVYTVWAASTVGDSEVSINLGGRTVTDAAVIILRANSEIRENEDPFFQMLSRTGGRPVINLNVITAATIRVRVRFIPGVRT